MTTSKKIKRGKYGHKIGICIICEKEKPIHYVDKCGTCGKKIRIRTIPKVFLSKTYQNLKTRCTNKKLWCSKYYYGKNYCTRDEFINQFINDGTFLKLYKEWQESNYDYNLIPSIDRIDISEGYVIGNMQFLTQKKNAIKDKKTKQVLVYDKKGNFIKKYESVTETSKELNIPIATISSACLGRYKNPRIDYILKFAEEED
jgi:hypothetical protein